MNVLAWIFIAAFLLCLYVYAGYPLLLLVLAHLRPRPVKRGEYLGPITVIIPAYNEEASIEHKVRNTLANGYPEHLLEILVASDGSTDRTNEIVRSLEGPRVRLLALPRSGKVAA